MKAVAFLFSFDAHEDGTGSISVDWALSTHQTPQTLRELGPVFDDLANLMEGSGSFHHPFPFAFPFPSNRELA